MQITAATQQAEHVELNGGNTRCGAVICMGAPYAALMEALKSATFALKAARIYHCGHTDNYVIAKQIDRLLAEPQEVRSCAN